MYYLYSRYYNPEMGRFISADVIVSTDLTGLNLFAYCENDPINRVDPTGMFWEELKETASNIGKTLYEGAIKVVEAAFYAFEFEAGLGYGYGASNEILTAEASITAYHDPLTIGFKDGKTYTGISGEVDLGVTVFDEISFGVNTSYEHRYETDGVKMWDEHTTSSLPWDVYTCPQTDVKPFSFSYFIDSIGNPSSYDSLFVGIGGECHFILGYHYLVGFDLRTFIEVIQE